MDVTTEPYGLGFSILPGLDPGSGIFGSTYFYAGKGGRLIRSAFTGFIQKKCCKLGPSSAKNA